MFYWIIFAVLGAIITLVLHESSHALCIIAAPKAKIEKGGFKPWPHKFNGTFYFGSVRYTGDMGNMGPISQLAPFIKALIMIPLWMGMTILWWQLFPLLVWEAIDALWWWRGWLCKKAVSDGGKLRKMIYG